MAKQLWEIVYHLRNDKNHASFEEFDRKIGRSRGEETKGDTLRIFRRKFPHIVIEDIHRINLSYLPW